MSLIDLLNKKLGKKVKINEILAPYTSYKIGGPAKFYFVAKSQDDLKKAVLSAKDLKISFFILARGSNVLIADKGFEGLLIHNKSRQIMVKNDTIIADSGINLSQLCNFAKKNNLSGLEFGTGIPGSLGGGIRGNAGAFGQELKEIVKKVVIIDDNGKLRERNAKECEFNYRESIFKRNQEIILSAELKLKKSTKKKIDERINEVIIHKRYEQEFEAPSAGCVFKNPLVSLDLKELKAKKIDPKMINQKGTIPAAYFIEKLGLKGFKIGQVMVSKVHANFIINLGGATAENVVMLIGIIKQKIRDKFGIQLMEEIQYVGF